jgi:hypothetical protein
MKNSKILLIAFYCLSLIATSCIDGSKNEVSEKSLLGKWEITDEREYSNEKLTSSVPRSGDFFEFKSGNIVIRTNPKGSVSTLDYKIVDDNIVEFETEEFGEIKIIQFKISFKSKDSMSWSRSLSPPNRYELQFTRRN